MIMVNLGIFAAIALVIWKIIKLIWRIVVRIIVWAGLWLPALYTIIFFIFYFIKGAAWAAVAPWFYVGLALSLLLGFMWFIRFTLRIGKRGKKKSKEKPSTTENK